MGGDAVQILTHSRTSAFRRCPRFHDYRYERGWVPDQDPEAIRIGTAFHKAKEAADLGLDVEVELGKLKLADAYEMALVSAMHVCHSERWAGADREVVATELEFDIPLINPETGEESPIWRHKGKIDRLYKLPDGRLCLRDYKSTTEDLAPDSDLWTRLMLDSQMTGYIVGARSLGYDVQVLEYDVTRRPMHRPYKATPVEERKFTQKASKLADGTVRPAGSLYAGQREADESPHEYVLRVAEAMRAEPDKYHRRVEIARLDDDIDEWRWEFWQQSEAIHEAQGAGRWYRNPSACTLPSKCCYLSICGARLSKDSAPPQGFKQLTNVHPELTAPVE